MFAHKKTIFGGDPFVLVIQKQRDKNASHGLKVKIDLCSKGSLQRATFCTTLCFVSSSALSKV